jgi:hypothetical protein
VAVGEDAVGPVGLHVEVATVAAKLAGDTVEAGHMVDPLNSRGAGGQGCDGLG